MKGNDPSFADSKRFDYTLDYLLMPLGRLRRDEAPSLEWERRDVWEKAGYFVEDDVVLDAPTGRPAVVEIMTSSTSGGNKATGTTIPNAFRRSLLDQESALGPGINYRQVWARMVSQLIVKSEMAITWGGSALWVLQDVLADYISATTALDLAPLRSEQMSEVNILSLSYGDDAHSSSGVVELPDFQLYAGAVAGAEGTLQEDYGFLDIIRAGAKPNRDQLLTALLRRPPANEILVS